MPRFTPVVLPLVLLFIVLLYPGCSSTQSSTRSFTALKFDPSDHSHIAFNPDMRSMTEKFSVCLWIRVLGGGSGAPFAYNEYEIFMTESGRYNVMFSTNYGYDLSSKFTAPKGTWYAYCFTWSLLGGTFKIYVDGKLVGSQATASGRRLETGHTMVLGAYWTNNGHSFRGEIFNFNFFSKELTATEVASLSSIGLCTGIPERLEYYRAIKWEEILKMSRSGTIQDFIDPRCAAADKLQKTQRRLDVATTEKSNLEASFNKTQSDLVKIQGLFNSTQQELFDVQGLFNSSQDELAKIQGLFNTSEEELGKVKDEFNSTQEELLEVKRQLETSEEQLNETRIELEETQLELKNVSESKCALVKGNLTKWDIFYSRPFYNKRFTRRLYQELRTTWDTINIYLFGFTMNDATIKLVKSMDVQQNCEDLS